VKIPDFKIEVPLVPVSDKLFGEHNPSPPEPETPSAPELAEANAELKQINAEIRDRDGRDVKSWKDVI